VFVVQVMGHGHDSKRTAAHFDGLDNEIPSNVPSPYTLHAGDHRIHPLTSSSSMTSHIKSPLRFESRRTSTVGKSAAGVGRSSVFGSATLAPSTHTSELFQRGRRATDINSQQLLREFLDFLVLKGLHMPRILIIAVLSSKHAKESHCMWTCTGSLRLRVIRPLCHELINEKDDLL